MTSEKGGTPPKGGSTHILYVQDDNLIAQNPGVEVNQLMNLPNKSCEEEEMIMSMDMEEEEVEDTTRLDQLSASITESPDMEEYSGGLRERARVSPGGAGGPGGLGGPGGGVGGGGDGGVDQRSKRKIGMGNGPPPPPPKSAPPPLPIRIL